MFRISRWEMQEASGAALEWFVIRRGAVYFAGEGLVREGFGGRAKAAADGSEIFGSVGDVIALAAEERFGVDAEPIAQGLVGEDNSPLAIERVEGNAGHVQQTRDESAGGGRARHGKGSWEREAALV